MNYKWNPSEYLKSSSNQKRWGEELISKINFKGNERVLDIGCGDGVLTALIASRVPEGHVLGIDSSPEMINLAKTLFPQEKHPNLEFKVLDVREMDFEREFDVVFSNACLHWVKDHLPVLEKIKKSLKPGGRIYLQMGGKGNAEGVIRAFEKVMKRERWSPYFKDFTFPYGFYGREEYEEWLKSLGFKNIRVDLISKDMVHEGEESFIFWVRSTWQPYHRRVPESLREEFIRDVVREYQSAHPPDSSGRIHVQMVRLEVEAEKP